MPGLALRLPVAASITRERRDYKVRTAGYGHELSNQVSSRHFNRHPDRIIYAERTNRITRIELIKATDL